VLFISLVLQEIKPFPSPTAPLQMERGVVPRKYNSRKLKIDETGWTSSLAIQWKNQKIIGWKPFIISWRKYWKSELYCYRWFIYGWETPENIVVKLPSSKNYSFSWNKWFR